LRSGAFDHFLPYLYVVFFSVMIFHGAGRDVARCKKKYGKDWDGYCNEVPYTFIPGVY
jgi:delta24(24(1))-sterol reductase